VWPSRSDRGQPSRSTARRSVVVALTHSECRLQQQQIARARRQAAEDAQEAAARESEATAAREVLDAAASAVTRAEGDVERLAGELREAETTGDDARQARVDGAQNFQDAESAAHRARQRAADSAARAEETGSP